MDIQELQHRCLASKAAYKAAAETHISTMAELFPIGSIVRAQIGRAVVDLRVTGHGHWYYHPGRVYGENIVTGAARQCDPNQIQEIVSGGEVKGDG